jgi:uncharacterized membrane protein YuzA (DUF378 family)
MTRLNILDWFCLILVIVGGLNWLGVGIFSKDLVGLALGQESVIARLVYILVGLATIWILILSGRLRKAKGNT